MEIGKNSTDAEQTEALSQQIDNEELEALLEGLARGVDGKNPLAIGIAELAARMQPASCPGIPLSKSVPLCLNAVFRRTVDWEPPSLDDRRVLPFFACTTKYLYDPVLRARSVTDYCLASVIGSYTNIEVAMRLANARHLAMMASDADPTAADRFMVRRAHQLRRWTMEAGQKEAPLIRAENTVRHQVGKGVDNLRIGLQRAMEDYGVSGFES